MNSANGKGDEAIASLSRDEFDLPTAFRRLSEALRQAITSQSRCHLFRFSSSIMRVIVFPT